MTTKVFIGKWRSLSTEDQLEVTRVDSDIFKMESSIPELNLGVVGIASGHYEDGSAELHATLLLPSRLSAGQITYSASSKTLSIQGLVFQKSLSDS